MLEGFCLERVGLGEGVYEKAETLKNLNGAYGRNGVLEKREQCSLGFYDVGKGAGARKN